MLVIFIWVDRDEGGGVDARALPPSWGLSGPSRRVLRMLKRTKGRWDDWTLSVRIVSSQVAGMRSTRFGGDLSRSAR